MITLAHLYPREMNIYGDTGNDQLIVDTSLPNASPDFINGGRDTDTCKSRAGNPVTTGECEVI